jgi:hypothetical protein
MDYSFASVTPTNSAPSYYALMTSTDGRGQNWACLANEENYRRVREMQQKNLIIPIVGDFAGPKAIKAVGRYLKDHGATVSVFYVSNVEDYLEASWAKYRENIAALPIGDTSVFMRYRAEYISPQHEGWRADRLAGPGLVNDGFFRGATLTNRTTGMRNRVKIRRQYEQPKGCAS